MKILKKEGHQFEIGKGKKPSKVISFKEHLKVLYRIKTTAKSIIVN